MLLKSLEIQGFKTFPEKTKLTFNNGITSIVGPNGSGKSNISDAIRWVLGEQSPKALRCSRMEDVVFNGTDKRKKQGYAQVTLTIENEDRALPFDGDEVAVTRRYYRSGDSEYMINKASVRLKDIHELFMDTGLGRDGYSMISQGKIDSIVGAKSEERREIFEEAAGISRFRYRKIEAERKLKGTEENLLRLRDIVTELEQRVGPLEMQSKKAQSFLEYSKEKRELEIGIWLDTLEKSAGVLRDQEEKISIARTQNENAIEELEKISEETERIFTNSSQNTVKIDEIRRENSAIEEKVASKKSAVSVFENDILHNNSSIERIENEILALDSNFENIEKDILEKKNKINEYNKIVDDLKVSYESCQDELNQINVNASRSSDLLQDVATSLATLSGKSADIKVSQITSDSSLQELNNKIAVLENSLKEKEEDKQEFTSLNRDYESKIKEINQNIVMSKNIANGLEIKQRNQLSNMENAKVQADKLQLDAQERLRRVKILEDLERNLEGFNHSVKTVMKQSELGVLKGIHGPVSRVIKVPAQYTVAIEIALGASMQNIVTTNEEDAKRAISYLKQKDGGRATFLPMTTVKGYELRENGLDLCEGFVGIASNLCSCEEQYKGVLNSILGRIVIVENLNFAVVIAKKYNYKFRIVTLDGQVVNAGGSLTGGSFAKKSGLLSRVSEIEKNKTIAIELSEKAEKAKKIFEKSKEELLEIQQTLEKEKQNLSKLSEEEIRTSAENKTCLAELLNITKYIDDIKQEQIESLAKQKMYKETYTNANSELAILQEEIKKAQERSDKITENREELTLKREQYATKLQDIRLNIVTHQKDIEAINVEINSALNTGSTQEERKKALQSEIETLTTKNNEIKAQIDLIKDFILQLEKDIAQSNQKITLLNEKRSEYEKRSTELRKLERDKNDEKELSGRELARLEERKINLQKQYDEIIAKLWEEYELTRREAQEIAKPIENIIEAKRRLNELKNKIKSLGSVNVSAIEEYKEVAERYEFMSKQVDDVEKSKAEILRLINDLTKQMKEIFVERFYQINEHFKKTFVELFGGGKAQLELANPEDILTSGIDIIVHPPGKIVVHLEALSGGEKALVAIALYFAIMKVSPSPFCVMDEIEAALDEVNVDRFASYLRIMNERTQFILITHRRGTMEEADVLYGVTMQDEGVSKLLELRATEVASKLNMTNIN